MKYVISYRVGQCLSLGDALLFHYHVKRNPDFMTKEKEYYNDHTLNRWTKKKLALPLITLIHEIAVTLDRAGTRCRSNTPNLSNWKAGEYFTNTIDPDDDFSFTHNRAVMEGNYIDSQFRAGIFPSMKLQYGIEYNFEPTDKELEQIERNLRILEGILEDNQNNDL